VADRLAGQGERVLALAWLEDPSGLAAGTLSPADLPRNLVLLGLIGLLDPPRQEAIEAVKVCHDGGIRVTMITGDHKITAAAIAKMLGIGDGKTAVAGSEIEEMNEAALQECVQTVDVFARASPEHKLRLVKAIQANGQIVAMTGDGVNDAPSLKKADIGVAMGIKGTEVTKEAAGMILADDNFASITAAVKEGRTVYNNIEKAILFMLPTNVAQGLVIAVAIFLGFTMPITAPQVLWVNMVTSVALGLVIAFEPHELDVMRRMPRAVDRALLTGFGIWRVVFVGLALLGLYPLGLLLDEGAGRLRRAGAHGGGQRHHHRTGLLSAQQPLPAGVVRCRSRPIWATATCRWGSGRSWCCSSCSPMPRLCSTCSTTRRSR
jgi:magnesium-transporting ATPase (P-type)